MISSTELDAKAEFSRPFQVEDLEDRDVTLELVADSTELAGLQARYGVDTLSAVSAHLTLSAQPEGAVKVSGTVKAALRQTCIISLEPVDETIEEALSVLYLPAGLDEPGDDGDFELDYEAFDGQTIDLGELTAQQIAGAINPYPRRAGVEFGNQAQLGDNTSEERDNPFAVLQALKSNQGTAQEH
ncbi:MAG: DUF177 domain-containing protein [Pseudomonadota bacterium]